MIAKKKYLEVVYPTRFIKFVICKRFQEKKRETANYNSCSYFYLNECLSSPVRIRFVCLIVQGMNKKFLLELNVIVERSTRYFQSLFPLKDRV